VVAVQLLASGDCRNAPDQLDLARRVKAVYEIVVEGMPGRAAPRIPGQGLVGVGPRKTGQRPRREGWPFELHWGQMGSLNWERH
jgi:hypothetical protein